MVEAGYEAGQIKRKLPSPISRDPEKFEGKWDAIEM